MVYRKDKEASYLNTSVKKRKNTGWETRLGRSQDGDIKWNFKTCRAKVDYKNQRKMKKILAIIEKGTDGMFSVYTPETESTVLNGQGETAQEAIDDMKVAMEEVIESYQETEGQVPEELQGDIEFEYRYDVPSLFNFFNEINMTTFSKKIGINASLLRRYKNGFAFASEKQIMKIKNGLHELGKQLSSAQL